MNLSMNLNSEYWDHKLQNVGFNWMFRSLQLSALTIFYGALNVIFQIDLVCTPCLYCRSVPCSVVGSNVR